MFVAICAVGIAKVLGCIPAVVRHMFKPVDRIQNNTTNIMNVMYLTADSFYKP